ncbi:MAG TPA: hypothetical protein PKC42_03830 [Candidatus Nanoperiomorbaceae bacterium]|nr:hypothetical protein [Candidatus Nanoperiomorbaceae bacterium]
MTDDYKKYEIECEKIRKQNAKLLDEFALWLQESNLKEETIKQHVNNIDFYINEYLLYEDATEAKEGVSRASMFLGYWFIKKAMWASPAQIKSNAASLKKFYTFMLEKRLINKEELDELKETIKEGMAEWVATMRRYDDPSTTDMEDVWGI